MGSRAFLLPFAIGLSASACGSTNIVEQAGPSTATEAGVDPNDPVSGTDAGVADGSVAHDAKPDDPPGTWTAETPPGQVLVAAGGSANGLIADPLVPRRLMLRLSSQQKLAIPWESGAFGPALSWVGSDTPVFMSGGNGGGFASDGTFYDFIAYHTGRVPSQVGVKGTTGWTWKEVVPPGAGSWPPRAVHVMPGTPVRVFFQTDSDLLEISSTAFFPPVFPLGPVGAIALSPDRTTYLGVSSSTLRRCTLTTGACNDVATSGIAADDTLSELWFDPYDGNRILVNARGPAPGEARHFLTSTDGGTTFAVVPLVAGTQTRRPLTVGGKPGTFVVETTATASSSQTIQITRDFGATWTELPFPPTKITDVSGLAVDAGGTLFLVRDGTLFSQKL